MYKIKKSDLLEEVMDCLENGKELVVYNYGGETFVEAYAEGAMNSLESRYEILYNYKFDAYENDDDVTMEDADWALDRFLLEALESNNVEAI